ncbi:hypothetical protein ACFQE5_04665 [Pseudonocardia hispaniensis]|uniref:Uncharacterized protein n=1 Tax=Pseudonocardia hispaniensis TaxID=904933 RepID=A0ABW1IYV9_9PSEU
MGRSGAAGWSGPAAAGGGHGAQRALLPWRVLGALLLLAMGGIHLYLVFHGFSGLVGTLFVLNAIGSLVLAVAMLVVPGRLLGLTSGLSALFMAGTLLALVLALTVGFLGVREQLGNQLVPTTLVVESVGTIVLALTAARASRLRHRG